jgi:hypothetical protein
VIISDMTTRGTDWEAPIVDDGSWWLLSPGLPALRLVDRTQQEPPPDDDAETPTT